jgi:hypothetical protein
LPRSLSARTLATIHKERCDRHKAMASQASSSDKNFAAARPHCVLFTVYLLAAARLRAVRLVEEGSKQAGAARASLPLPWGSSQRSPRLNDHPAPNTAKPSTQHKSTNMDPIQEAIADLESQEPGKQLSYSKLAAKWKVNRVTLTRRHKGIQGTRKEEGINRRKISPQQEAGLVEYIIGLTERGFPPTRNMIKNFASVVAGKTVGEGWVTRFINRNKDHLMSQWTNGIDRVRHEADSEVKYKYHFDLLHSKMEEYHVLPQNTYNMDEKGFMIGCTGRSKRVFGKELWERKEIRESLQDGLREWITVLACVGADGSALPLSLIFQAANGNVRSTWVQHIEAGKHDVFVTSSPSGWTNNDIGLAWLEQVFDRKTKIKAQGRWRLLIIDGHGSHFTQDFLDFCEDNHILLFVFPAHSTHTLQPLDVVMFKPLSSSYSESLATFMFTTQGYLAIKKGDFFPLFWHAWITSFKEETVLKSFEATGIWPKDPEAILKRFHKELRDDEGFPKASPPLDTSDWRQM